MKRIMGSPAGSPAILVVLLLASATSPVIADILQRPSTNGVSAPRNLPLSLALRGGGAAKPPMGQLFTEWLSLTGAQSLEDITNSTASITKNDALIVIDMQQDFVQVSKTNADGGRFGVPEVCCLCERENLFMSVCVCRAGVLLWVSACGKLSEGLR
jgi:hypothetical protein